MCPLERGTVSGFGGAGWVDSAENVAMLVNIPDTDGRRRQATCQQEEAKVFGQLRLNGVLPPTAAPKK
jgi:hypothetical protein